MARKSIKKKVVSFPQNREELIEYLKDLNQAVRKKEAIESRAQERKDEIDRKTAEEVKPLDEDIEEKAEGIYLHCQTNRVILTENNKVKTVPLPGGTILWRFNPRFVNVKNEALAILELEKEGLNYLIRIKKEVNKEAILEQPGLVADLKNVAVMEGDEVFAIKPADVKIELEKGKRKFKRKKL